MKDMTISAIKKNLAKIGLIALASLFLFSTSAIAGWTDMYTLAAYSMSSEAGDQVVTDDGLNVLTAARYTPASTFYTYFDNSTSSEVVTGSNYQSFDMVSGWLTHHTRLGVEGRTFTAWYANYSGLGDYIYALMGSCDLEYDNGSWTPYTDYNYVYGAYVVELASPVIDSGLNTHTLVALDDDSVYHFWFDLSAGVMEKEEMSAFTAATELDNPHVFVVDDYIHLFFTGVFDDGGGPETLLYYFGGIIDPADGSVSWDEYHYDTISTSDNVVDFNVAISDNYFYFVFDSFVSYTYVNFKVYNHSFVELYSDGDMMSSDSSFHSVANYSDGAVFAVGSVNSDDFYLKRFSESAYAFLAEEDIPATLSGTNETIEINVDANDTIYCFLTDDLGMYQMVYEDTLPEITLSSITDANGSVISEGDYLTTDTVDIAFTASDNMDPTPEVYVLVDGVVDETVYTSSPIEFDVTAYEGQEIILSVLASDECGNQAESDDSVTCTVDTVEPNLYDLNAGTPTGDNGYYLYDVTVTIVFEDAASGVASLFYYINDDEPTEVVGDNTSLTISDDGTNTLYYWAVDNAGNYSVTAETEILIDQNDPTLSESFDPADPGLGEWYNEPFTFTVAGEDGDGSGISTVYFSYNDVYYVDGMATELSWPEVAGDITRYIYAEDYAGRTSDIASFEAKYDPDDPETTVEVPTIAGYWHTTTVVATLSATDVLSDVASVFYALDPVDPNDTGEYTEVAGATAEVEISTDGEHTLYYYAVDNAGNDEEINSGDVIKVDLNAPTLYSTFDPESPGAGEWYNTAIDLTLSATDEGGAGIGEFYYVILDPGADPLTATYVPNTGIGGDDVYDLPLTISSNADKVFYSYALDTAGWGGIDENLTSVEVKLDLDPPVVSFIDFPSEGESINSDRVFEFLMTDTLSMLGSYSIAFEDSYGIDYYVGYTVAEDTDTVLYSETLESILSDMGYAVEDLTEGEVSWELIVTDVAGTSTTNSGNFYYDITEPSLDDYLPADESEHTSSPITMSITISDNLDSVFGYPDYSIYLIDDEENVIDPGTFSHNGGGNYTVDASPADATYSWSVTLTDEAGNTYTSDTYTFTVDSTRPYIDTFEQDSEAANPSFIIEVGDDTSGVEEIEITILDVGITETIATGVDAETWSDTYTLVDSLTNETYLAVLTVTDNLGWPYVDSLVFVVDSEFTIAIDDPEPYYDGYTNEDPLITWTIENDEDLSTLGIRDNPLDPFTNIDVDDREYQFTGLADGSSYLIHIQAVDEVGNISTEASTFTVDDTDPQLGLGGVSVAVDGDDAIFEFEITDNLSGVKYVAVDAYDDGGYLVDTLEETYVVDSWPDLTDVDFPSPDGDGTFDNFDIGTYTYNITLMDQVNNVYTYEAYGTFTIDASLDIDIDSVDPSASIGGIEYTDGDPELAWTITSDGDIATIYAVIIRTGFSGPLFIYLSEVDDLAGYGFSELDPGYSTIEVHIEDEYGYTDVDTVEVYVDLDEPVITGDLTLEVVDDDISFIISKISDEASGVGSVVITAYDMSGFLAGTLTETYLEDEWADLHAVTFPAPDGDGTFDDFDIGTYTYDITLIDQVENLYTHEAYGTFTVEPEIDITIDDVSPFVTIGGTDYTNDEPTLSWTVTADLDIVSLDYQINSSPRLPLDEVDDIAGYTFSVPIAGDITLQVFVEDEYGYTDVDTVEVRVDVDEPVIAGDVTADVDDDDITIGITEITDDASGVGSVVITAYDESGYLAGTLTETYVEGEWEYLTSVTFPALDGDGTFDDFDIGTYTYDITLMDQAENIITHESYGTFTVEPELDITIDDVSPFVTVGEVDYTNADPTLTWTITSDGDIDAIIYEINDLLIGVLDPVDDLSGYEFSGLSEGDISLEILVEDEYGYTNVDTVEVFVDEDEPAVTDGVAVDVDDADVTFTFAITDDYSGVAYAAVAIYDSGGSLVDTLEDTFPGEFDPNDVDFEETKTGLDADTYSYTVTLQDEVDNISTSEAATFMVEAFLGIELDELTEVNGYVGPDQTISWTVTKDESATLLTLSIDDNGDVEILEDEEETTHEYTELLEGSHTIAVEVTDDYGNTATDAITVEVDRDAPTITSDITVEVVDADASFTFEINDDYSGVAYAAVAIYDSGGSLVDTLEDTYSGELEPNDVDFSETETGLDADTYSYTITLLDEVDNIVTFEAAIFTVEAYLGIELDELTEVNGYVGPDQTISWTVTKDELATLQTLKINNNESQEIIEDEEETTHEYSNMLDGTHIISVEVTDDYGNIAVDAITVEVDEYAPIVSGDVGVEVDDDEATFTFDVNDEDSGVAYAAVAIYDSEGSLIDTLEDTYSGELDPNDVAFDEIKTGLDADTYSYTITLLDEVDNISTSEATAFTVEAYLGIELDELTEVNGYVGPDQTISWTVTKDDVSTLQTLIINDNESQEIIEDEEATTHEYTDLTEGTHTISVEVTDDFDNTATDVMTVEVDEYAPTLSGEVSVEVDGDDAIFEFDIIDDWSGVSYVAIAAYDEAGQLVDSLSESYVVGEWLDIKAVDFPSPDGDGTFDNLDIGTYTYYITLIDQVENLITHEAYGTFTVEAGLDIDIDSVDPTVTVDLVDYTSANPELAWTVTADGDIALLYYEITDASGLLTVGTLDETEDISGYTFSGLLEGNTNFEVFVVDQYFNIDSDTEEIFVDADEPTISGESTPTVTDDDVSFDFDITDDYSGVDYVAVIIYDATGAYEDTLDETFSGELDPNSVNFTGDKTGLDPGTYSYTITLRDEVLNIGTTEVATFSIGTDLSIVLDSVTAVNGYVGPDQTIGWTVTKDDVATLQTLTINDNGDEEALDVDDTSYDYTDLDEGSHVVAVEVTDDYDNTAVDTMTFEVDANVPSTEADIAGSVSDQDVSFSFGITDDLSGVASVVLRVYRYNIYGYLAYDETDTETFAVGDWFNIREVTYAHEIEELDPGTYDFTITSVDQVGNSVTSEVGSFEVFGDLIVEFADPATDPYSGGYTTADPGISWTITADGTISYLYISIDDEVAVSLGIDDTEYSFEYLEEGSHTVVVEVYTDTGNYSSAETTIGVDTTGPELDEEEYYSLDTDSITLASDITDSKSGVESWSATLYRYSEDGVEVEIESVENGDDDTSSISHTYSSLENGKYLGVISLTDVLGNTTTVEFVDYIGTLDSVVISGDDSGSIGDEIALTADTSELSEAHYIDIVYTWSSDGGAFGTPEANEVTFSSSDVGTYTVTVSAYAEELGITVESSTQITVDPLMESLVISADAEMVVVGADVSLSAVISGQLDLEGEEAVDITEYVESEISWESSDGSIVGADTSAIFAADTTGTYTITASVGELEDSVDITVVGTIEEVDISASDTSITVGGDVTLTAAVTSSLDDEDVISYIWSGDDLAYSGNAATFSAASVGTYSITVGASAYEGLTAAEDTIEISVAPIVDSITVSADETLVSAGTEVLLTAEIIGQLTSGESEDITEYSAAEIVWESDGGTLVADGATATFSADEDGTYTITASYGGEESAYDITINSTAPVISVMLDGEELEDGAIISASPSISIVIEDLNGVNEGSISVAIDGEEVSSSYLSVNASSVSDDSVVTAYTVSFGTDFALESGTHILTVTVSDANGMESIYTISGLLVYDAVTVQGTPMNYPNPFKPGQSESTTINYTLTADGDITIQMYDLTGRQVWASTYSSGAEGGKAGANNVSFDGQNSFGGVLGNGVYHYLIISEGKAIGRGQISVFD